MINRFKMSILLLLIVSINSAHSATVTTEVSAQIRTRPALAVQCSRPDIAKAIAHVFAQATDCAVENYSEIAAEIVRKALGYDDLSLVADVNYRVQPQIATILLAAFLGNELLPRPVFSDGRPCPVNLDRLEKNIKTLLQWGANSSVRFSHTDYLVETTALAAAIRLGCSANVIAMMLERGADPDQITLSDVKKLDIKIVLINAKIKKRNS